MASKKPNLRLIEGGKFKSPGISSVWGFQTNLTPPTKENQLWWYLDRDLEISVQGVDPAILFSRDIRFALENRILEAFRVQSTDFETYDYLRRPWDHVIVKLLLLRSNKMSYDLLLKKTGCTNLELDLALERLCVSGYVFRDRSSFGLFEDVVRAMSKFQGHLFRKEQVLLNPTDVLEHRKKEISLVEKNDQAGYEKYQKETLQKFLVNAKYRKYILGNLWCTSPLLRHPTPPGDVMAENSLIAWTNHTFNPWRGYEKVSAACKFCYAEHLVTKRHGLPVWGAHADRRIAAESSWKNPLAWNKNAVASKERHRVFCASLADVFEDREDLKAPRARLARLIEKTSSGLDWLLLTKRPENMLRLASEDMGWNGNWPDNVWAGTSVESQEIAEKRIPQLIGVPAKVRFLSCEPLLEKIDLSHHFARWSLLSETSPSGRSLFQCKNCKRVSATPDKDCPSGACSSWSPLHWVIVGGENHLGKRLFDVRWAKSLLEQCRKFQVSFFMKQMGSHVIDSSKDPANQRLVFKDRAGADPEEWSTDLFIQEMPR